MNKINKLTTELAIKIGAGEIIERPVSVVKELVENSIDAGASRVEIAIFGGGLERIEVSDNGHGIAEGDLDIAFLNHTTSKISSLDDIFAIETLGFRGEALASISAVSHVQMTTRTPFSDIATQVEVEAGQIASKTHLAANVGTKIVVSDLFFNTQPRKKFLKTDTREGMEITQFVTKLILTNPYLEVKYSVNGKLVYHNLGTDLEEAIYTIYGAKCLENCLPIHSIYKGIEVRGYIGNCNYTKANSTYQTFSVNGRYVKENKTFQIALRNAFSSFVVSRSYPFCVLSIKLSPHEVDVNAHPSKLQVRFVNDQDAYRAVYIPVKEALRNYSEKRVDNIFATNPDFRIQGQPSHEAPKDIFADYNNEEYSSTATFAPSNRSAEERQLKENSQKRFEQLLKQIDSITVEGEMKRLSESGNFFEQTVTPPQKTNKNVQPEQEKLVIDNQQTTSTEQQESLVKQSVLDLSKVRVVGVAFDTYLVIQIDQKMVLIDQHAAHERLLYDKFMKNIGNHYTQSLMFPYVFSVNHYEGEFLSSNLDEINKGGVTIEPFGENTFRITATASMLENTNLKTFVQGLLESVNDLRSENKQFIAEKVAKKACKAAVKGGDRLTDDEIEFIVKEILQNKILQCPHGRPIISVITQTELEKMFKRIV